MKLTQLAKYPGIDLPEGYLLAIPMFDDEDHRRHVTDMLAKWELDEIGGVLLSRLLGCGNNLGKMGWTLVERLPDRKDGGAARHVMLFGMGSIHGDDYLSSPSCWKSVGTQCVNEAVKQGFDKVAIMPFLVDDRDKQQIESLMIGARLGAYRFDEFRSGEKTEFGVETLIQLAHSWNVMSRAD